MRECACVCVYVLGRERSIFGEEMYISFSQLRPNEVDRDCVFENVLRYNKENSTLGKGRETG